MSASELAQLELLAQIDDLTARLNAWCAHQSPWEPLQQARSLLKRLLQRLDPLRLRLEAPLVVATFGGTGVGKSSLVNALVGDDVATVGRERPTTTQPTLIAHPDTDLAIFGFPLDEMRIVRRDTPLLRDLLLIDCPDPDTTEAGSGEWGVESQRNAAPLSSDTPHPTPHSPLSTNLARLHRILPYCDVLLYVSTQQKYRSARVGEELAQAAEGCKIVFVQTHADLEDDIRDDWRRQLDPHYRVAEMFYVDSRSALAEERSGMRPTGEFGRLLDLLFRELSSAQRVRIRRGNLFGLVQGALERILGDLQSQSGEVQQLERALGEQRQRLVLQLTRRCEAELLVSRGLWERRVLGQVTQLWGLSPFSLLLRAYHGQSSLISSVALMRAHSSAQLALWGAFTGARWISSRQQEATGEQQVERLAQVEISEADLQQLQVVLEGHLRSARLERNTATTALAHLRQSVAHSEGEFWSVARKRLDELIFAAAQRHSTWPVRWSYEIGFAVLPVWLLYRIGRNFFYDSWIREQPLLESHFYIPAALFLALWCVLWLIAYARRLRRGVERQVRALAEELATARLSGSLFPELEQPCRDFHRDVAELRDLNDLVTTVRRHVGETTGLSAAKERPGRPELREYPSAAS
jgi:hypothetical protein